MYTLHAIRLYQPAGSPGLGLPRPKALVVIPKYQPLPQHLRKKRVKVQSKPATMLQKKVKITMYLGLDIII